MSFRYPRFYLFGGHHYYEHLRLPQLLLNKCTVWVSHVHVLPYPARNTILLRVSTNLLFAVASIDMAGFVISESLTDTIVRNEA